MHNNFMFELRLAAMHFFPLRDGNFQIPSKIDIGKKHESPSTEKECSEDSSCCKLESHCTLNVRVSDRAGVRHVRGANRAADFRGRHFSNSVTY